MIGVIDGCRRRSGFAYPPTCSAIFRAAARARYTVRSLSPLLQDLERIDKFPVIECFPGGFEATPTVKLLRNSVIRMNRKPDFPAKRVVFLHKRDQSV